MNHPSSLSLAAAALCGLGLVSCNQVQPSVYGSFDARQKTLAVPATNFGGIPVIKDNLRKAGWDIRVANANTALRADEGILSRNATSRYSMAVEAREVQGSSLKYFVWWPPVTLVWLCQGCPSLSDYYNASVTIYDNKDAREILTYAGPIKDNKKENDIVTQAVIDNTH